MELLGILFKINLSLLIFYLVYRYVLRALTFYNFNRLYLLFSIAISTAIPFMKYSSNASSKILVWQETVGINPQNFERYLTPKTDIDFIAITEKIYWAGVIVMASIFLIQLASLIALYTRSNKTTFNGFVIRTSTEHLNPFSFFQSIFVNPQQHTSTDLQSILQHEAVHVKQWHSIDVILGEIKRIFCWFNPIAWLMLSAIRENLEFIADRKVLLTGIDKKMYQYALLNSEVQNNNTLSNHFNFSHLKMRITMMNKTKSSDSHLLKYLLAVPVISMALLFTNSSKAQNKIEKNIVSEIQVPERLNNINDINQFYIANGIDTEAVRHIHEASYKAFLAENAKNNKINTSKKSVVLLKESLKNQSQLSDNNNFVDIIRLHRGDNDTFNLESFSVYIRDFKNAKKSQDKSKSIINSAINNKSNDNSILLINGKVVQDPFALMTAFNPDNIQEMAIHKGDNVSKLFPTLPSDKIVIDITTNDVSTEKPKEYKFVRTPKNPIIIVDGVQTDKSFAHLDPKMIKTLDVIKDPQQIKAFNPSLDTERGLIVITTNDNQKSLIQNPALDNKNINIYPNPTSTKWTITLDHLGQQNSYELFDQKGNKRAKGNLQKRTDINTQNLETGIYFLIIKIDNTTFENRLELVK